MPTIHTPRFTFSSFAVTLLQIHTHTPQHTANPVCQSLQCPSALFTDFFSCSFSVFCPNSFYQFLSGSLSPSALHLFVISVVLWGWPTARERQVQEFWPDLPASLPKLHGTVPITLWPTKAFPGLALVTRGPPPTVVTGGVIRCLFYCNPKNVPASRIHATGSTTAMFQ